MGPFLCQLPQSLLSLTCQSYLPYFAGIGSRSSERRLYLAGIVQQCRQVLGGQGLVFDNDSSDPDPHENKS